AFGNAARPHMAMMKTLATDDEHDALQLGERLEHPLHAFSEISPHQRVRCAERVFAVGAPRERAANFRMRFEYWIVLGKLLASVKPGICFKSIFAEFFHSLSIGFERAGNSPHGELGNRVALRERVQVAATVEHRIEAEKY